MSNGALASGTSSNRDWLFGLVAVASVALAMRLIFAVLTRDTYDYDEFVVLLLGRDLAHGSVPYRDFMFFHPPGILVLIGSLQALIAAWWPSARILELLLDSGTAALVWFIGRRVWNNAAGIAAGLVYAAHPLAIVSATRVGQDTPITFLGFAGIALLVSGSQAWRAILAGVCLALAVWIKYPALVFLPVYALLAPRRALWWLGSAAIAGAVLFAPFLPEIHQLYSQTVTFQSARWKMVASQRVETTALYWLIVNPLALVALFRFRPPLWMSAGFILAGAFALSAQVYYHYFVPVAPFAALLSAGLVAPLLQRRWTLAPVAAMSLAITLLAAAILDFGGASPLFVTAGRLSAIAPTITLIDRETSPGSAVLADRYEYAYLSNRAALAHYFWNVGVLVDARYLERRVGSARAVVLSYGASSGFPAGFVPYLNRRYPHVRTAANTVWLVK